MMFKQVFRHCNTIALHCSFFFLLVFKIYIYIYKSQNTDSCYGFKLATTQPTITCSKLTIKILEQDVKYV